MTCYSYRTVVTQRAGIVDIPVKVFTENILPLCEARDMISLGYTNRFFALVTTGMS